MLDALRQRNEVDAFCDRDIDQTDELVAPVCDFRTMLSGLHSRLPYPHR